MNPHSLSMLERAGRLWNKTRRLGFKMAFRSVSSLFRGSNNNSFPLANADPDLILASSLEGIRQFARRRNSTQKKKNAVKDAAGDSSELYPNEFIDSRGTRIHYASYPALRRSKGLAVIFHGFLGFKVDVLFNWADFDLLLPLDNFGWKNLGSWFWGVGGKNFVELAVQELIQTEMQNRGNLDWFCTGGSAGAFAALYHGIKYRSKGIYVTTPIIQLKPKIKHYRQRGLQTTYTALADPDDHDLKTIPDIYQEARLAEDLPPLFLIQNQYDRANPFGEDTLPLLQIYAEKRGWAGLRVQPSIGHHGHDGSYAEAQHFFNLISEKRPPRKVDFFQRDEASV